MGVNIYQDGTFIPQFSPFTLLIHAFEKLDLSTKQKIATMSAENRFKKTLNSSLGVNKNV